MLVLKSVFTEESLYLKKLIRIIILLPESWINDDACLGMNPRVKKRKRTQKQNRRKARSLSTLMVWRQEI